MNAPGIGKCLAEIEATDGKACVGKRFAQVVYINLRDYTAGDAAVVATFSISSDRRSSRQQDTNGNSRAYKYGRRSFHREQIASVLPRLES
jgi:hypothetical protein